MNKGLGVRPAWSEPLPLPESILALLNSLKIVILIL